jgi:hypothetical protein
MMSDKTIAGRAGENRPDNAEIAAFVEGLADKETARRVLSAALTDPSLRERVETLIGHDERFRIGASVRALVADAGFSERADRLKVEMRSIASNVAREPLSYAERAGAPDAEKVRSAPFFDTLAAQFSRTFQMGRQLLTLPCFAPVMAADAPALQLLRQTIQTGEGVRIEFQQLPGGPQRLRVLVDASQLDAPTDDASYNVAYLTLEEGSESTGQAAHRHVLIVPLNRQTRGFSDFVVGSSGSNGLPAPTGSCRFVSATLSRLPGPQAGPT